MAWKHLRQLDSLVSLPLQPSAFDYHPHQIPCILHTLLRSTQQHFLMYRVKSISSSPISLLLEQSSEFRLCDLASSCGRVTILLTLGEPQSGLALSCLTGGPSPIRFWFSVIFIFIFLFFHSVFFSNLVCHLVRDDRPAHARTVLCVGVSIAIEGTTCLAVAQL